jgi:hypothetical protein
MSANDLLSQSETMARLESRMRFDRTRGAAGFVAFALALSVAQAGAQPADPSPPRTTVNATALDTLRMENAALAARVDSLTESLRQHRVTENFFNSELATQTGLYGVVVAAALVLFGLLTYGGFRYEVRRHKREMLREMEKQMAISARADERLAEAERFMRQTAANSYVAISSVYDKEKPGWAIAALLLAGANFYAAHNTPSDRNDEVGAENINEALRKLNEIQAHERRKVADELAEERGKLEDAFELLNTRRTRDVDSVVATIRVRCDELIREATVGRLAIPDAVAPGSIKPRA